MKIDPGIKKFLKRVLLFNSSIFFILCLLFISSLTFKVSQNAYMFALLDKNKNLAESHDPERIIFLGSSNLAFGLDSPKVEKIFHKKVINMGLNAALGLNFTFNDVRDNLRGGDTVIIVPPYSFFFDDINKVDPLLAYTLLYVYPKGFSRISLKEITSLSKFVPNIFLQRIPIDRQVRFDDWVYARDNFNSNGDMIGHLGRTSDHITNHSISLEQIAHGVNKEAIGFFNDFSDEMTKKNIKTFFIYPSYISEDFKQDQSAIDELQNELQNELKIPILSKPETYSLNVKYFYDTTYHLNKEGRELNTNLIIKDLEKVIKK